MTNWRVKYIWIAVATGTLLLSGCTQTIKPPPQADSTASDLSQRAWVLKGATIIEDEWEHIRIVKETEYRIVAMDERVAIRARAKKSASSLMRYIDIDPSACPIIEWSWRVENLQQNADIKNKQSEDVAASVFIIFGDPGIFGKPNPVPTLRYVWTTDRTSIDAVVTNPYANSVKSIVIESGETKLGQWVTERRNIVKDFEKAFGPIQQDNIQAFALFTDNDQTKQPVEAYYEWIRMICSK